MALRACMFCGGKPLTKEHIFPEWLRDAIPVAVTKVTATGMDDTPKWSQNTFDIESRIVCGPCNSGWMSDLESVCAPLLSDPILFATPWLLTDADQHSLAMWATKTAMTLEAHHRGKAVFDYLPEWHARWMPLHRDPPPNITVWLFATPLAISDGHASFTFERSFGIVLGQPPNEPKAYVSTFVIGNVGLQVFGSDTHVDQPFPRVTLAARWQDATVRIWPATGAIGVWPPSRVMDAAEVEEFSRWGRPPT